MLLGDFCGIIFIFLSWITFLFYFPREVSIIFLGPLSFLTYLKSRWYYVWILSWFFWDPSPSIHESNITPCSFLDEIMLEKFWLLLLVLDWSKCRMYLFLGFSSHSSNISSKVLGCFRFKTYAKEIYLLFIWIITNE